MAISVRGSISGRAGSGGSAARARRRRPRGRPRAGSARSPPPRAGAQARGRPTATIRPCGQNVDDVGLDVVEQALVVGDQQDAQVGVELGVDALGDDAQRVDVEAGVGLVEDRQLGLQHGHLEHLEALLLAAREALVDVARGERVVELEQRHLLAHQHAEVAHADAAARRVRRVDLGVGRPFERPRRAR